MRLKAAFLVTRDGKGEVGIGDSIVITFDDYDGAARNKCIVVDGGYSQTAKVLRSYLKNEGIATIDLVVATHIDDDHINGLRAFFRDYVEKRPDFKVLNYWGPAPKQYEPVTITEFLALLPDVADLRIDELSFISQSVDNNEELYEFAKQCVGEGHIWHPSVGTAGNLTKLFGSVKIEILGPDRQVASAELESAGVAAQGLGDALLTEEVIDLEDMTVKDKITAAAKESDRTANNQSIVIRLTPINAKGNEFSDGSFLLPGDAENESWERMIEADRGSLRARYLKVAHHGSQTGTNEDILDAVKPEYGVICGGKNKHGLPDGPVLTMLQDKGVKIICTGRNPEPPPDVHCCEPAYQALCPRCDAAMGAGLETPVVFEIDTDPPPGAPPQAMRTCGNSW